MFSSVSVVVIALAFVAIFTHRYLQNKPPAGFQHAPGPKGAFLIGNTLQLSDKPHRDFIRWAREYGEVYKVQIGWNNWFMLNSPEAVKDIMDRQSALTSSRNPMPVASDTLSGGMRFLFMPYGPEWRRLRGATHKLLTPKMSDTFQPSQDFEAKRLLMDFMDDNKDGSGFYMHVRRYTVSVIMTSTYGRRVPEWVSFELPSVFLFAHRFIGV